MKPKSFNGVEHIDVPGQKKGHISLFLTFQDDKN